MERSLENWKSIMNGKSAEEIAMFILDDLAHYPSTRRGYYSSDIQTLASALRAYREIL